MLVIDANTGKELKEGTLFRNVNGLIQVKKIYPGIFEAWIDYDIWYGPALKVGQPSCSIRAQPLTVRWLHPSFLFRHVAFLQS